MFRFAVLVALISISYGYSISINELHKSFEQFKVDHGVVYADAKEEAHRLRIFAENLKEIKSHNEKADKGLHSYWLGINKFADLTDEEIRGKYLGLKGARSSPAPFVHKHNGNELPSSVDWRDEGAVTDIKNQAQCGSCWAFSAVAAIEGANFLANGKLVSLSEQNIVDCDSLDEGCDGGWMFSAFEYVISNEGIDTESGYPYDGYDNKCRYSAEKIGATISSYANVTSGDEKSLLSAIAQQPISVGIDATPILRYDHGIVDSSTSCGSKITQLDHGVTVVGYGTEGSKDYYIVRNSWGSSWGEAGYFRLERGSNLCGIATAASYPIV